jgi:hypothetical protein
MSRFRGSGGLLDKWLIVDVIQPIPQFQQLILFFLKVSPYIWRFFCLNSWCFIRGSICRKELPLIMELIGSITHRSLKHELTLALFHAHITIFGSSRRLSRQSLYPRWQQGFEKSMLEMT